MKIGVLSDTHISKSGSGLPDKVIEGLRGVDLILHAGDIVEAAVLDELGRIAKVEAVYGNMDPPQLQRSLPAKKIINIGDFKLGLIHGYGPPFNMINTLRKEFPEDINVIVFGHSHSPVNEYRDGVLFFNPGSPTDKAFARYNSYGMLIVNKTIKGEIIKI